MGVHFGGPNCRKIIERGDLKCALQYVNGEEAGVFAKAHLAKVPGAYVLCISSVHKYADDAYLVKQAQAAAQIMGFKGSKNEVKRIADFMADMLIEILTMQPEPDNSAEMLKQVERLDVDHDNRRINLVLH